MAETQKLTLLALICLIVLISALVAGCSSEKERRAAARRINNRAKNLIADQRWQTARLALNFVVTKYKDIPEVKESRELLEEVELLSSAHKRLEEEAFVDVDAPAHCSWSGLKCMRTPPLRSTRHGWKINNRAHRLRKGGDYRRSLCIAGTNTALIRDKRLLGAVFFEIAMNWKALGCLNQAHQAIKTSIEAKRQARGSLSTVCRICRELGAGPCPYCG